MVAYLFVFLAMFEALKLLDRNLFLKINSMHTPFMDGLMWFMSRNEPTIFVILAVAFIFYKKFSLKKAVEFILGCAIVFACTDLSTNVIKHNVQRYRPTHNLEIKEQVHIVNDYHGGKYGFFSAHAANSFGIITFIFFCARRMAVRYRLLIFIYPLVVGYSRLYLGVHYPSDIFIGAVSGLLFGGLVYSIMNRYFLKLDEAHS